jgi:hypothetical protein
MKNIQTITFCIGIGINQFIPEYFTLHVDNTKQTSIPHKGTNAPTSAEFKAAHSFVGKNKTNSRKER